MNLPAIVLLAHGSPDPDWMRPVAQTRAALAALAPDRTIAVATLGTEPATCLDNVVAALVAADHTTIVVTALFLSAGGRHVKKDLPHRVAQLKDAHPNVRFELTPGALGEDPEVTTALANVAYRAALATNAAV